MTFPSLTLPERPLRLGSKLLIASGRAYLWIPVMLLFLAVALGLEAPGLLRDFFIRQNPVYLDDGSIRNGRCQTRKAILTTCSADLDYTYKGTRYSGSVDVMFIDFNLGDYETDLVISGDNPAMATMSLGLDMFWNRALTLLAVVGIISGSVIVLVRRSRFVRRTLRRIDRPGRLTVVPVVITAYETAGRQEIVTYGDTLAPEATGNRLHSRFQRGEEPLIVDENEDKPVALAVRHSASPQPILLDRRLTRITDLTEAERRQALDDIAAATSPTFLEHVDKINAARWKRRGMAPHLRLGLALGVIPLTLVAGFGYWVWYVTSSSTPFVKPGMQITNILPGPINRWGCNQLKQRFGSGRPPFGCATPDGLGWK